MRVYGETSALVKLVVEERETQVLRAYLAKVDVIVSSRLTAIEIARAVRRHTLAPAIDLASVVDRIEFRELTVDLATRAAALRPPELRTLDAIHLATALELAEDIVAFVTYDQRLADAARSHGLPVVSPA